MRPPAPPSVRPNLTIKLCPAAEPLVLPWSRVKAMQDLIIVAGVLSVILAAAFLVAWLLYRKQKQEYSFKEFMGDVVLGFFERAIMGIVNRLF
jgi:hypothetical protein